MILFLASSEISAFIAPSSQSSSGIAQQQQCINPIIKQLNKNRESSGSTSSLHVSFGGGYTTTGAVNTVLSSLKIRHPAKVLVLLLIAATTILLTATKRGSTVLWPGTAVSSDNEYSDVPLPPGGYGCPFFGKFFLIYSYKAFTL